jgi:manganese/zinc/iron transport system permease protein
MSIIPDFDLQRVFIEPWTRDFASYGWVMLMGFLVATACGLVGNYLILRRMALVGDAISHSVLPGLAIAFLLANSRSSGVMFAGALAAGIVTTLIIEIIHRKSRVKQDAAIGITFSSLFAIGVILISLYASKVDLDQECVLYGEIGNVGFDLPVQIGSVILGPAAVVRMAAVVVLTVGLILLFYKEL